MEKVVGVSFTGTGVEVGVGVAVGVGVSGTLDGDAQADKVRSRVKNKIIILVFLAVIFFSFIYVVFSVITQTRFKTFHLNFPSLNAILTIKQPCTRCQPPKLETDGRWC